MFNLSAGAIAVNLLVVAGEEDFGNAVAAAFDGDDFWPSVDFVAGDAPLFDRLIVTKDAWQATGHRVENNQRWQFAAGHGVIANRDFFGFQNLFRAGVYPFIASGD